jgi:hypothetical protein
MNLWKIEREDCHYDEVHTQVIAAVTEEQCRKIASEGCGYEGPQAWINPNESEAYIIKLIGPGLILAAGLSG